MLCAYCACYVEGIGGECCGKPSNAATGKRFQRAIRGVGLAEAAPSQTRFINVKLNTSIAHPQKHGGQTAGRKVKRSKCMCSNQCRYEPALPQRLESFLANNRVSSHAVATASAPYFCNQVGKYKGYGPALGAELNRKSGVKTMRGSGSWHYLQSDLQHIKRSDQNTGQSA